MLAVLLFLIYLGTNLGTLLLASAMQKRKTRFVNSTAVTVSEAIKAALSVLMIWAAQRSNSLGELAATVASTLFSNPAEIARVCVPALLYTIQNNVIYVALQHLDAVTFQIVYQMKIVSAALAHRFLLGKQVSRQKWFSVVLLTVGVVLVQLSQMADKEEEPPAAASSSSGSGGASSSSDTGEGEEAKNPALGLAMVWRGH